MNKIILSEKQLKGILSWRDKNKDLVRSFLPYLVDGEIQVFEESGQQPLTRVPFKVEKSGDLIFKVNLGFAVDEVGSVVDFFYLYDAQKGFILKDYKVNPKIVERYDRLDGIIKNNFDKLIQDVLTTFCSTNAYLFHYQQDLSIIPTKEVKRVSKLVKGIYKYSIVKSMDKLYKIVNKVRNNKVSKSKQWVCDAWGVRGHYRHYADGRVSYIFPYIKGKDKDKEINKTILINKFGGNYGN